jgi:hypothetical protein
MANVNVVASSAMTRHVHDANSLGYKSVIYTPKDGDAETIDSIVHWEEGIGEFARPDGSAYRGVVELELDEDDVPSLQAGDKFTIDGAAYSVDRNPTKAMGLVSVQAIKIEQREKARPNRHMPTGG